MVFSSIIFLWVLLYSSRGDWAVQKTASDRIQPLAWDWTVCGAHDFAVLNYGH